MNDPISQVDLNLDGSGHGTVVVNGEDITRTVVALQLVCDGSTPRIMLHERAGVKAHVEGIVEKVVHGTSVLDFLKSVSPNELEKRTLDKDTMSVPDAFIEVLTEMAVEWQQQAST